MGEHTETKPDNVTLRDVMEHGMPVELIAATEHHGPYIINQFGQTVCDFYTMSNPLAASIRNGGESYPVPFWGADHFAEYFTKAVNAHEAMKAALEEARQELLEAADKFHVIHCNHPGKLCGRGQEEDKQFCAKMSDRMTKAANAVSLSLAEGVEP